MFKPLIVKGKSDPEQKRCYDCYHCQGAVNWWCTNNEAVAVRSTIEVGIKNCEFWKSALHKHEVGFLDRLFGDWLLIDGE